MTPISKNINNSKFNLNNINSDQLKLSVDFNENLFNIEVNKLNKIINHELENQNLQESQKLVLSDKNKS